MTKKYGRDMLLQNKRVLIIGGGGLIGRALTVGALQNGASVVAVGRNISDDTFSETDPGLIQELDISKADITDPDAVENLFESISKSGRPLDAVVNCAFPKSDRYGEKFEDVAYEDFCENLTMHLGGAFLVCQKAAAYFERLGGGNIINFSSIYGFMAPRFEIYEGTRMTKEVEYILSKSGIIHLTRYLAKYLKGKNIRVNCVSPGGIIDDQPPIFIENYNRHCMNKGMMDSEDVLGTVLFLLSDHSAHITGQNIVVDDGFSL